MPPGGKISLMGTFPPPTPRWQDPPQGTPPPQSVGLATGGHVPPLQTKAAPVAHASPYSIQGQTAYFASHWAYMSQHTTPSVMWLPRHMQRFPILPNGQPTLLCCSLSSCLQPLPPGCLEILHLTPYCSAASFCSHLKIALLHFPLKLTEASGSLIQLFVALTSKTKTGLLGKQT